MVCMCVKLVFILTFLMKKKLRRLKNILPQRREVVISGNRNCFYWDDALQGNEISDEKHEEIQKSSDNLFEE